eukprot:6473903-Amphidinium_carterae.1
MASIKTKSYSKDRDKRKSTISQQLPRSFIPSNATVLCLPMIGFGTEGWQQVSRESFVLSLYRLILLGSYIVQTAIRDIRFWSSLVPLKSKVSRSFT